MIKNVLSRPKRGSRKIQTSLLSFLAREEQIAAIEVLAMYTLYHSFHFKSSSY